MRFSLLLLALTVTTAAVGRGVVELTKKTFDPVVLRSDRHTLVEFYASWCTHCKRMLPEYEKLAEYFHEVSDVVQVVKIDGDKNGRIRKRYGVDGYPTFKLFKNGGLEEGDIIEYEGSRDMESMKNFVLAHTKGADPPVVKDTAAPVVKQRVPPVRVYDANFEAVVLRSGKPSLIAVTASWCGHCKLLYPVLEELAGIYAQDAITIGVVQTTDVEETSRVKSAYGVKSFPTILYFDGVDPEPTPYKLDRLVPALVEYLNAKAHLYRAPDGGLTPGAGVIESIHTRLEKLDRSKSVSQGLAELVSEIENDDWMAKWDTSPYYVKVLNKIRNGQGDFLAREQVRLQGMLTRAGASLVPAKKEEFQKRINILHTVQTALGY